MQTSKLSVSVKLAALGAALAFGSAAYAASGVTSVAGTVAAQDSVKAVAPDQSAQYNKTKHHHKHSMHRQMRDAAMWVPGYGPLGKDAVESLALNADQAKLLEAARAEQKEARSERRDAMKKARAAKLEQIKSGKIDPHAALKQSDEIHQKAYAERRQLDEKWLAVWDALDDAQKSKLSTHLTERAEKFAKRMEDRKQRKAAPVAEKASS